MDPRNCWGGREHGDALASAAFFPLRQDRYTDTHRHTHISTHTQTHTVTTHYIQIRKAVTPGPKRHDSKWHGKHTAKARGFGAGDGRNEVPALNLHGTSTRSSPTLLCLGLAMLEEGLAVSCVQISRVVGEEFHCNWSCLFQG